MRCEHPSDGARHRVLGLAAILGSAGMLAAAAAVAAAIGSVHRTTLGTGRFALAGLVLSYPAMNTAEWVLIGLAAVGATTIAVAGRAAWRQRSAYRGLLGRLEVVGQLGSHPAVNVIVGSRPEAFCAGFLRPAIYISQGALELLTTPELEAVLAHEQHHRRVRDPLRFAFGRVLGQALFFVPVIRSLRDRYAELAEVTADRAAVRAAGGRASALASALLVFEAGAPPGATGISPERVDSLLGQPARWRLPVSLVATSLAALSGLSLLIWQASAGASARASFNLPLLSPQPCVVMLMLGPLLGCFARRYALGRRWPGPLTASRSTARRRPSP